jgi:hypothetical protein
MLAEDIFIRTARSLTGHESFVGAGLSLASKIWDRCPEYGRVPDAPGPEYGFSGPNTPGTSQTCDWTSYVRCRCRASFDMSDNFGLSIGRLKYDL